MRSSRESLACSAEDLFEVENLVRSAGTSFERGMRILPPFRRQGMFAIYAFCRELDDIADGDHPQVGNPADAEKMLERWKGRIEALYQGHAETPLERVLLRAIQRFGLQRRDFLDLISGMEMDVRGPVVAPSEEMFDLYCDRVASSVGRLSVRIFGEETEKGRQLAFHLGRALQITNILRDIRADAAFGRLYFPRSLLERFGIPVDPKSALSSPGLGEAARILSARAKDHFRAARAIMRRCPRVQALPAALMAAAYQDILMGLDRRGWTDPLAPPHRSRVRKLALLAAAMAKPGA